MKTIREYAVPFAVGVAAALLAELLLSPFWSSLGWRKPVADWMVAIGIPAIIAAYWGMVWVNLSSWIVAVGAGLVVGSMSRQSSWVGFALATCLGFMLTPHLLVLSVGYHIWVASELSVAVTVFLWNAVAAPLILLPAWLVFRRRHPKAQTAE